jgi:hypothetical protein
MDEAERQVNRYGVLFPRWLRSWLRVDNTRFGDGSLRLLGWPVHIFSLPLSVYPVFSDAVHRAFTRPNTPPVAYPEGFQGNEIPIDGALVARYCIERLELVQELDEA